MRRIVVLGCGFGGFESARQLERLLAGRRRVQITLVNDRPDYVYTPLLPAVATGELDASHITFPIEAAFGPATDIVIETITQIDLDARRLRGPNADIPFDYLTVACGNQIDWSDHPQWASSTMTCQTTEDADQMRDTVGQALADALEAADPKTRARQLTFVVCGAGPAGVELASELLTTLQSEVVPRASTSVASALRVVLVEQSQRVLPNFEAPFSQQVLDQLGAMGMELRLGTRVVDRHADTVTLSTGEQISADHFIWCGGRRGPDMVAEAGFEVDPDGRIRVDDTLQTVGLPGIYAVGDIAAVDGVVPGPQSATQQAVWAARNIVASLSGRTRRPWEYHRRGNLITLGRQNALAFAGDSTIDGRAARALYRLIHTALIPTGVKKTHLLKDWVLGSSARPAHPWTPLTLDGVSGQLHE